MILELVGIGGVGYLANRFLRKKKEMSTEREQVYKTAMRTLTDPLKIRSLADVYEKEGLKDQAAMLRKRADLNEEPASVKQARRAAFKKGMQSTDKAAIEALAVEFEKKGAEAAAEALRQRIASLP